jgi:hypothetical protein
MEDGDPPPPPPLSQFGAKSTVTVQELGIRM